MSHTVEEKVIGPYRLEVWVDDYPFNPLEDWDAMPTILHWHSRYNLGTDYPEDYPHPFHETEAAIERIKKDYGATVVLPLYIYDHSGITVSTKPFSCQWDSGQVGFVFMSAEAIKAGWGDHPHPTEDDLPDIITSSVKTYDKYLRGDVYGYTVEGPDGLDERCGGFFDEIEDVMKEAESYVDPKVVEQYEQMEALKKQHPDMLNLRVC